MAITSIVETAEPIRVGVVDDATGEYLNGLLLSADQYNNTMWGGQTTFGEPGTDLLLASWPTAILPGRELAPKTVNFDHISADELAKQQAEAALDAKFASYAKDHQIVRDWENGGWTVRERRLSTEETEADRTKWWKDIIIPSTVGELKKKIDRAGTAIWEILASAERESGLRKQERRDNSVLKAITSAMISRTIQDHENRRTSRRGITIPMPVNLGLLR